MPTLSPSAGGNPCHEPAGSSIGGRFAHKGQGICHPTGHSKPVDSAPLAYAASHEVEERWIRDFAGKTGVTLQQMINAFGTGLTPSATNTVPGKVKWDDDYQAYAFMVTAGTGLVQRFIRPDRQGATAIHDVLLLGEGQGKGIGKRMLAETFRLYEQLGVTTVEMKANVDVGSYAWARYGFDYDPTANPKQNEAFHMGTLRRAMVLAEWNVLTPAQARDFAKASVTPGGGIWKVADTKMKLPPSQATAVVEAFLTSTTSLIGSSLSKNLTPETIAGLKADAAAGVVPVGKLLLLDRYWSARFRMNNPAQRDRLRAYVGRDVFKD